LQAGRSRISASNILAISERHRIGTRKSAKEREPA
jgi:hypothetical protein